MDTPEQESAPERLDQQPSSEPNQPTPEWPPLSEASYIEKNKPTLAEAIEAEEVTREILVECHNLIEEFGFFNPDYGGDPLSLPDVLWDKDGSDLGIMLEGKERHSLGRDELEKLSVAERTALVREAYIIYYPPGNGQVTAAVIRPYGIVASGYTGLAEQWIRGFNDKPMSLEALLGLKADLLRYRELVGQHRFPVNSPHEKQLRSQTQ